MTQSMARATLALATVVVTASCAGKSDNSAAAAADSTPRDSLVIGPPTVAADSTVPWTRIAELVNFETSKVRLVRQNHALMVTVLMKDGRAYHSKEAQFDAVVRLVQGIDKSNSIPVVTE